MLIFKFSSAKFVYIVMQGIIVATLLSLSLTRAILDNMAVNFQLSGLTNYIPSSGGLGVPGYTFTLGYDKHSWIGIQFMTPTQANNFDTLIVQRTTTPTGGVYTCSIKDFYVAPGQPNNLMNDMFRSLDQVVTTTADTSAFSITIPRTIANTSGQDWIVTQFQQICFFTSDSNFDQLRWSKQYQVCYGYQITNYQSTFRGMYIANMQFQGSSSVVYGGLYGPLLSLQLFWYRPGGNLANSSSMIIQMGSYINSNVGYDYYKCGAGDFYGPNSNELYSDLEYSGYQDGSCNVFNTNSSTMLLYTRSAYTFDDFDFQVASSMQVCLIGTMTHCATFSAQVIQPVISIKSALTIHESFIKYTFCLLILLATLLL